MSSENEFDVPRWYVIHTRPSQEDRADSNLKAWNVETFSPRRRERRLNQFTGKPSYISRPLFPRYIFARFGAQSGLHKVSGTRGVHKVVTFGCEPIAVSDETITILQLRIGLDGFVRLNDELLPGDDVIVRAGSIRSLSGIFDREIKGSERVRILLTSINFQAHITVDRELVERAAL